MTAALKTEFASPQRQDQNAILDVYRQVKHLPYLTALCDALPHVVMILNNHRQIVFSNQKLLDLVGLSNLDECLGLRPGELFNCMHAESGPSGCGTGKVCRVCGAVLAVLESQRTNERARRELRLAARIDGNLIAFDFEVSAAPFSFGAENLTIVNLIDISDQKRRRVLERIFFHDILNTAGSLLNLTQLISKTGRQHGSPHALMIHLASKQLVDEIRAQRQLMEAENGELKVNFAPVDSLDCLRHVIGLFKEYQKIHRVRIQLAPESESIVHSTDQTLLLRVLGNMIKNALEACRTGQTATAGCRRSREKVTYWVKNPHIMPQEVQLQIFQRSFTTKGKGRGLGTYSIRLLTEKFLGGKASFESSEAAGTCFTVTYPLTL